MDLFGNEKREWSRSEIRGLVGAMMDTELQVNHTPARSILPQKITPADLDSKRPGDGAPLAYNADQDLVTFGQETVTGKMHLTSNESTVNSDRSWLRPGATSSGWTEDYDHGDVVDVANERLEAPVAGIYLFQWQCCWGTTANTTIMANSRMVLNGAGTDKYGSFYSPGTSATPPGLFRAFSQGGHVVELAADDYIYFEGWWAFSSTPGGWSYQGGDNQMSLTLMKAL